MLKNALKGAIFYEYIMVCFYNLKTETEDELSSLKKFWIKKND